MERATEDIERQEIEAENGNAKEGKNTKMEKRACSKIHLFASKHISPDECLVIASEKNFNEKQQA